MPTPEVQLLQSLAGHQTLGCITGLFHIFEGHPAFMGRSRVSNGQSQLRTQVDNQSHRHDRRDNPFSKHYQPSDIHKKAEQSTKHSRSHSDVTDLAMTPSRTVQGANGCGQIEAQQPACSEGTVDAYRRAATLLAGDLRQDRGDQDSRRKVVFPKASGRDHAELATNAYPDQDVGLQHRSHGCHRGSASPRSSSFYARASPHEPSELLNWKDGLRSSTASPPRKLSHHNSPERRVEPKKDRGRSLSRDQYSMSPKRFQQSGPHPQVPRHGDRFKESPGASEFRECLKPFLKEPQHVAAQESSFASRSTGSSESHQVPNVIARLMGLEETIPSSTKQKAAPDAKSRGEKFFRGLVQFDPQNMRPTSPPPPPPCKCDVQHQAPAYRSNYPAQYKLEQELCSSEEDRDYDHFNSLPFLCEHQEATPPEDTTVTVAPEKKKRMIRKILEAMRPKALLKISRRKQMEQEKPPVSKLIAKDVVQPVEELLEESQPVKLVTSLKLPVIEDQPPRYTVSDTSSVKMQEQQTESKSSSESSVVNLCDLQPDEEDKDVVMKHVDTASTTSTEKKMIAISKRTAQDWNQRRVMKPGTPPRSARAGSKSVESDYESDPSSCGKTNDVRESRKTRTTTARKRDPGSRSPTPDTQRRCSSPGKDQCKTSEVGGRLAVVKAKKGSRVAQDQTLKKRVTDVPNDSRLCKISLDIKPALNNTKKPTRSIRGTGAARKLVVCTSNGLNSALLPPASAQPQTSDSEPVLEMVQAEPERSNDSQNVNLLVTLPDVQKTAEVSQGDHTLDNPCDVVPQLLLQKKEVTLEELTTPRGIPLHCEKLDAKLDEGELDRPSPISVLDINTFEEELTPSPKSPRHSFPVLHDSETTYNDEGYESPDKDLEASLETPEDDLNFDGLFSRCAEDLRVQIEETDRLDKLKDDEERVFVKAPLSETLHEATTNSDKTKTQPEAATIKSDKTKTQPEAAISSDKTKTHADLPDNINESLLESLRSNGTLQENNHILLLDCLEEIMERILESQSNLWCPELTTKGKQLEQELWTELRDIEPSEDICETVHRLLQRDLIKRHGQQWSTFSKDREQIGIEIEKLIIEDLIEGVVRDLCALQLHSKPNSLPRRQLFTN